MSRELTRREMQVLGFVERHEGEAWRRRHLASVIDMGEAQASETLSRLVGMGYISEDRLTVAGRKMLWPHYGPAVAS